MRCVDPIWSEYPSSEPIPNLAGAQHRVVGRAHGCALTHDGTVRCWGAWTGARGSPLGPAVDVGLTGVTDLAASPGGTCAVADGEVLCWGTLYLRLDEPGVTVSRGLFGGSRTYYPTPTHPRWE